MNEINERFFQIADQLKLKGSDLVKMVEGMTKQRVSNAKSGRNSVPMELIQALANEYSVNANYIMTGKGNIFIDDTIAEYTGSVKAIKTIPSIDSFNGTELTNIIQNQMNDTARVVAPFYTENLMKLPYVPISATATFVDSLYNNCYEMETYSIMAEEGEILDENCMVFQIDGDSMEPTIPNGVKILAKKIDDGQWENADGVVVIVYGKILTVKRIKKNALFLDNKLILKADNPTHGEMEVERREIRAMWHAERIISQKIL